MLRRPFVCIALALMPHLSGGVALAAPDLRGRWVASWLNDTGGYYREFSRRFTGTTMTAVTRTVIDNPAQGMYALDIEMHYTYTIVGRSPTTVLPGGEVYDIDLVSHKVLLVPRSFSAAGFFRNTNECGYSDWVVDEPKDVSGRVCRQTGPSDGPWFAAGSHQSHEIIGLVGEVLRSVDVTADPRYNGTTPALRPRAFSPFHFQKRD